MRFHLHAIGLIPIVLFQYKSIGNWSCSFLSILEDFLNVFVLGISVKYHKTRLAGTQFVLFSISVSEYTAQGVCVVSGSGSFQDSVRQSHSWTVPMLDMVLP